MDQKIIRIGKLKQLRKIMKYYKNVYCKIAKAENNVHGNFVGNKTKRRISKRVFKKIKHVKFSEKRTFFTP